MPEGVVKWFNSRKGFGFIKGENGLDVFVHYSDICNKETRTLKEGDRVTYDLIQGEMGPKAAKVVKNLWSPE